MARVFRAVLLLAVVIVSVSAICRYDSKLYDTSKIIPYECYHYTPEDFSRHAITGSICDKDRLIYTQGYNVNYPGCNGTGCHCCREKEDILETGGTLKSKDGCSTCTCLDDGLMQCKSDCGVLACHPKLVQSNEEECCPTCLEGCYDEALGHVDVGVFTPAGGCGKCTCHKDGSIECVKETCQVLTCGAHAIEMNDKACCPKCIGCIIDGGFVAAGEEYKGKDPCKTCQCKQNGLDTTVKCKTQSCGVLACHPRLVQSNKGECCPTCREGCWDETLGHVDVGVFTPAGGCGKCTCHKDGSIECVKETCQVLTCGAHAIEMNDKACCPKCIGCIIDGRFVAAGEEYKGKDPCKTCQCKQNGLDTTVKCKTQSCGVLACHPRLVQSNKGECCPTCREGCWDEALGHQDVGVFTPAGGCGKCTCHTDGSIECVKETCQVLTCGAHAIEMNDKACCPKCIGCIIDGLFVAAGEEYTGKDPCKICRCKQNGADTTVQCKTKLYCSPCGEEYIAVQLKGKCCPRCVPKPACHQAKCAKLRCPKINQFQTEDMCCPQCMCKHRRELVLPGIIGDKCDGKVCNGETGKKTRTKLDCPKNIKCANPVLNKDTCCYDCPDEIITCMHPRTKKIITKGQYLSSKREICTCLGDPWFPYAFCAKRKLRRRDFRGFKNNFADYMEGGNSPA